MASALALKRFFSSNPLRPAAPLAGPSVFRTFAAAARAFNGDEVDDGFRRFLVFRPSEFTPSFSSGPQGPYSSTERDLDYEGLFLKRAFDSSPRYGEYEDHQCFGWDFAWTKEGINLRFAMAGFGKDDVKVKVNKNALIIKGKGEGTKAEVRAEYNAQVLLPEGVLKLDQVKAEMKNGLLSVVIPKLKEEEKADVLTVEVE